MPVTVLPAMLLAFGVGAVAGNYASGQLADRLGPTRMIVMALIASSLTCLLMTVILEFLPQSIAGPLLVAIMLPWGFVGWTFPPAQASRLVGHAPELANLTLPLNVSAMYFGIAFGSFIGGQVFAPCAGRPSLASLRPHFRWWRWLSCLPTHAGAPSASQPNEPERLSHPHVEPWRQPAASTGGDFDGHQQRADCCGKESARGLKRATAAEERKVEAEKGQRSEKRREAFRGALEKLGRPERRRKAALTVPKYRLSGAGKHLDRCDRAGRKSSHHVAYSLRRGRTHQRVKPERRDAVAFDVLAHLLAQRQCHFATIGLAIDLKSVLGKQVAIRGRRLHETRLGGCRPWHGVGQIGFACFMMS